jgi:methyl-accepting chemotaxis protein
MGDLLDRDERLAFLKIDEGTRAALKEFHPILVENMDEVMASFGDHVGLTPDIAALFKGCSMDQAWNMQRDHWLNHVFGGEFGDEYFASSLKIGRVNERVGLEPRWYIAGYCLSLNKIVEIASVAYYKKPKQAAAIIAAVNKVAFLDMDLAISAYIEAEKAAAEQRINDQANHLEEEIGSLTNQVVSTASQLADCVGSVSGAALEALKMTDRVTGAASEASANVHIVATAADELSSAIAEIGQQVARSTTIANAAKDQIEGISIIIQGLDVAARRINDVVNSISAIARQTNLLALNVALEANRSGVAGRSFVVVTGDVKSLANHTTKATSDIFAQLKTVQLATQNAVVAINGIGRTILNFSGITTAIAVSVEQQGVAIHKIARNISLAAYNTNIVSASIGQLGQLTTGSGAASARVSQAAFELTKQSGNLSARMKNFVLEVRNKPRSMGATLPMSSL